MNYPPLTPDILSDFLNELLGFHDKAQLTRPRLLPLIQLLDPEQQHWHLEGDVVWRIKAWRQSQERLAREKAAADAYNSILFDRKAAFEQLITGVQRKLGIEREAARVIALTMLKNKTQQAAEFFGVDIKDLPELPNKHVIIEGKEVYEL